MATLYGAKKIYNLSVELLPVIKIIQEEQSIPQQIVSDTITIIRRDTVIIKDTALMPLQDLTESTPKDGERESKLSYEAFMDAFVKLYIAVQRT